MMMMMTRRYTNPRLPLPLTLPTLHYISSGKRRNFVSFPLHTVYLDNNNPQKTDIRLSECIFLADLDVRACQKFVHNLLSLSYDTNINTHERRPHLWLAIYLPMNYGAVT